MRRFRTWTLGAAIPALLLACSGDEAAPVAIAPSAPKQPAGATADSAPRAGSPAADEPETAMPNQPPQMTSISIEGRDEATVGRELRASVEAIDPDGDAIEYSYRWSVNGGLVSEEGPNLDQRHFVRGDSVQLSVRASDGNDSGEWLRDDPLVIGNAAPRITSTPGAFDPDGTFRYRIGVDDQDGDRNYRYRVVSGPEGMRIDGVTGVLEWTPEETQAGLHPVTISVDDRRGGIGTQDFDVQVDFEEISVPASPAQ